MSHWRTNLEKIHEDLLTQIIFLGLKKFLVGGWWCLNPILVFSLSLDHVEHKCIDIYLKIFYLRISVWLQELQRCVLDTMVVLWSVSGRTPTPLCWQGCRCSPTPAWSRGLLLYTQRWQLSETGLTMSHTQTLTYS